MEEGGKRERRDIMSPKLLRGITEYTQEEKDRSEDLKESAVLFSSADSTATIAWKHPSSTFTTLRKKPAGSSKLHKNLLLKTSEKV